MDLETDLYYKVFLQALANPALCTGTANERELMQWFGAKRSNITKQEIALMQAWEVANTFAAMTERMKSHG